MGEDTIGWPSTLLPTASCQKHKMLQFEYEIEILRVVKKRIGNENGNEIVDHCSQSMMTKFQGFCHLNRKHLRILKQKLAKKQDGLYFLGQEFEFEDQNVSAKHSKPYGVACLSLICRNGIMSVMFNMATGNGIKFKFVHKITAIFYRGLEDEAHNIH